MNRGRRDIRWILVSAAGGGGIVVCTCAAPPCLFGRFSSWQRWPISRLMLMTTLAWTRICCTLGRGPRTKEWGWGHRSGGTPDPPREAEMRLTIAGTVALHRKSYGCVGSRGRHGSPCAVSPPLGDVSYHQLRNPLLPQVLASFLVGYQ